MLARVFTQLMCIFLLVCSPDEDKDHVCAAIYTVSSTNVWHVVEAQ